MWRTVYQNVIINTLLWYTTNYLQISWKGSKWYREKLGKLFATCIQRVYLQKIFMQDIEISHVDGDILIDLCDRFPLQSFEC